MIELEKNNMTTPDIEHLQKLVNVFALYKDGEFNRRANSFILDEIDEYFEGTKTKIKFKLVNPHSGSVLWSKSIRCGLPIKSLHSVFHDHLASMNSWLYFTDSNGDLVSVRSEMVRKQFAIEFREIK